MNYMKHMLRDKAFLRKTIAIAIPVALQNLLNNFLNLVDVLMIGKLGETAVASVGLANKVFFVFSLLLFGICSGSSILAAQYWGKREPVNIKRVLRISLLLGVGGSLLFLVPSILHPEFVMRIFTPKDETIRLGATYLWIIAFSYPLTAVTNVYASILRSMNFVKLPVIITTFAIMIDVFLNYCLIFGNLGFPHMGVAGSALATLIARIFEVCALLLVIYTRKAGDDGVGDFIHSGIDKVKEKGFFLLHKVFIMKFFATAAPVILNEFMWGLGVTMYSLVYGRMGDAATAAITITGTVEQVAMVFFFGICNAAAVILGNELGADELDRAERYAKHYMVLQLCLTLLMSVITILGREVIVLIYGNSISPIVAEYIKSCLLMFALFMPVKMLNALIIVAILRCGGDTKAALFLDVTGVWIIGIPMAIIGGLVLQLPIYIVYGMIMIEEVYKLIFGFIRYRKKKWLRNIVAG